ncbi:MAG TPA: DEAD/DEAH box helicase family protein [Sphingorhabdus sp.]|nr:DEAD/DEAH box helicase family protein [Sphingorhabdus sp.]
MELKAYQQRSLDQLRFFLRKCRSGDFAAAYSATIDRIETDDEASGDGAAAYAKGGYTPVEGLETQTPYCCIRLPTGGGKTLLAAHAVKIAAEEFMERAKPPVLWLVPSNPILTQTLDALKQPRHPYRLALEEAFGAIAVFDIEERRQISPQDFANKCVVIVGTMQTFRVTETSQRNVYSTDQNLERHFRDARFGEGLEVEDSGPRKGDIKYSFANLLHRQRPLLILDEAHNFMTGLSGAVKERLNPAAIIEFTATPKPKSNVISAASAIELKNAEMIKMPIHLTQHGSWQQAVAHAVQNRAALEKVGLSDPQRIRPITLYQAQPQTEGAEATVELLKQYLTQIEKIPEDAIAIATGDQRGLDGVNLLDPACKIEHVITVQALKEGWDCSFAYVFCSVASIRSAGAVEQLLGRVLRMPFASRRVSEELNRAYAHVSESNFATAAQLLTDRLTEMGFDEREARKAIIETPPDFDYSGGENAPLFVRPTPPVHRLPSQPDLSKLSPAAVQATRTVTDADGGVTLTVAGDAPEEVQREVAQAIEPMVPGSLESVERFIEQRLASLSPAERGVVFDVPRLQLTVQGELDLAETETFIELAGWDLLDEPAKAELPGFHYTETGEGYAFDIEGDTIVFRNIDEQIELALDDATDWDAAALSRFLDRGTKQIHTPQPVYLEYCRWVVTHLLDVQRMPLAVLVRGKYALRRAVIERVKQLREQTAQRGVQMFLGGMGEPVVSDGWTFRFDPYHYNVASFYQGPFRPNKHYYARMGKLNGFEVECARIIDGLSEVETWVRNGEVSPGNYSIPTSKGNFFPDFVAKLHDGRVFVIEAKGRVDDYDREKDNIARQTAECSGGRMLFVTLWEDDKERRDIMTQLRKVLP